MKLNQSLLWLLFSFATLAQGAALDAALLGPPDLKPERYQAQAAHLAADVISRYHYKAAPIDSALSEKIFAQYLKALDGEKYFFVQADIDRFAAERGQIGGAILREDLSLPFSIFNLFKQRMFDRFAYARYLLKQGMDFQTHEVLELARDKLPWPQSETDMRDLWRRRVKNDWLRLKIVGNDSASIAEVLDKRYAQAMQRVSKVKSEDAFQTFMNAFTMSIDPHTNYMVPRSAEEFDISMRLSLTGIGATLAESEDYATIKELIAGGPASLSGQLHVGDRIVGVGQGATGPLVDILGWRPDDAIELIRGDADSIVRLDILPAQAGPDGEHVVVTLVRKPVHLDEQAARSSIESIFNGAATHRIGVITLPSFYEDFAARQAGSTDYRSATRDVARMLDDMKKQHVDSLLIDLRNNGGGSLVEAVELTGLFVGNSPVVQLRKANGSVTVEQDAQAKVAWSGPLGILINRGSASASEIFAAAMQDYGRGLVIGDPSYGKGTVQTMVDLDRIAKNEKPRFGELKMTVAQFFRVNGGTTQLRGVTPDIPLKGGSDEGDFGEASYGNALPWTQIKPADYSPNSSVQSLIPALRGRHEARLSVDADMKLLYEDIARAKHEREISAISLNEAERRKERDVKEARQGSRNSADQLAYRDDGLQANERDLAKSLAAEKVRKEAKDIYLMEAARIMSDEIDVLGAEPQLANGKRPSPLAVTSP